MFSHSFASQSWGYEEISVAVPETSTYPLILGVVALGIVCRRHSLIKLTKGIL